VAHDVATASANSADWVVVRTDKETMPISSKSRETVAVQPLRAGSGERFKRCSPIFRD
jgi:hypothetical protein